MPSQRMQMPRLVARGRYRKKRDRAETNEMSFMEEQRKAGEDGVQMLKGRLSRLQDIVDKRKNRCIEEPANAKEVFFGHSEKSFKEAEHLELDFQQKVAERKAELLRNKLDKETRLNRRQNKDVEAAARAVKAAPGENVVERLASSFAKFTEKPKEKKPVVTYSGISNLRTVNHDRRDNHHGRNASRGMGKSRSIADIMKDKRQGKGAGSSSSSKGSRVGGLYRSASSVTFSKGHVKKNKPLSSQPYLGRHELTNGTDENGNILPQVTERRKRKVADVIYIINQDDQLPEVDALSALRDTLSRLKIPKALGAKQYFMTVIVSRTVEVLTHQCFWFAFCKYFQPNSEIEQDHIIAQMAPVYTLLLKQLTMLELESGNVQKDRFFRFMPFILAEAVLMLLRHVFPATSHIMDSRLRTRLDLDFSLLIGGVQLSEFSHKTERAWMFKALDARERMKYGELTDHAELDEEFSDEEERAEAKKKSEAARRLRKIDADSEQLPENLTLLERDYIAEEKIKYQQSVVRRARPRVVRFTTTLMTPILQRGLQRPSALPVWTKGRQQIHHPMPIGDSWLGGEDTHVPWVTEKVAKQYDQLHTDCNEIRKQVRMLSGLSANLNPGRKTIALKEVLQLETDLPRNKW